MDEITHTCTDKTKNFTLQKQNRHLNQQNTSFKKCTNLITKFSVTVQNYNCSGS